MATDTGISRVVAFLHELFPTREISPATLDAWALVFSDWSDDDLRTYAVQCAKERGRTFFPTPGEIAALRPSAPLDVVGILYRIEQLGYYDPNRGWVLPTNEMIRQTLGDEIANAYSVSGATSLFADAAKDGTTVTRDIARRQFSTEIERVHKTAPDRLRLPAVPRKALPAPADPQSRPDPLRLAPGPLADVVADVIADAFPDLPASATKLLTEGSAL